MRKISYYKNALDNKGSEVDLLEILAQIRGLSYKNEIDALQDLTPEEYKEAKKNLPAVTFAGLFSERKANALVEYSGVIVIDIDNQDKDVLADLWGDLQGDEHVFGMFVSPSGRGLKVLFKLESGPEHHGQAFKAIERYFRDKYATAIDKSGKDICRLCFVSADENLYYNKDSKPFLFEVVEEKKRIDKKLSNASSDIQHIFNVCVRWTERKFSYQDGEKNTFIHNLACTLNRCGVEQSEALALIDKNYLTPDEKWYQSVDSAYKHNTHEHGTVDVMAMKESEAEPQRAVRDDDETTDLILDRAVTLMRHDVPIPVIKDVMTSFAKERTDLPVKDLLNRAFKIYKEESKDTALPFMEAHEMASRIISQMNSNAIPTGFSEFDEAMEGGLIEGNSYGVIGPGETFKSIIMQWVAINAAKNDIPTLYLNGEMSGRQFFMRGMEMEFKVDIQKKIQEKSVTAEDMKRAQDKLQSSWKGNLFVVTMSGFTEEGIVNTIKTIEHSTGKKVRLVIMDGIKQMEDAKKDEIKSAIYNSGRLKEIAKTCHVAVLALYHLSGEIIKHFRNTGDKVRGGQNTITNMDGWFGTSLLIDEKSTNETMNDDIIYFKDKVYMRFHDKRGDAGTISRIIAIHRPTSLEVLSLDPNSFEVNLSTQRR